MVIALDGPAGSGKSSTAKEVARRLKFVHLDTGAMYRAITLKCLRLQIRADNEQELHKIVGSTELCFCGSPPDTRIWMDDEDVTRAVRSDEVTKNVSDYCAPEVVRKILVEQQRSIGRQASCVCEGRDIGTVVFPQAEVKFFLVASDEARARRRQKDFCEIGITKSLDELIAEIRERDRKDSTRSNSPLKRAGDAEVLDTTSLAFNEQVERIVCAAQKCKSGS
ncbi:MAG: (d)CMP kinase [Chitinivibrionales bacterium]|nr:(d)CMP kinase [Chitinivibrionales bacterium]